MSGTDAVSIRPDFYRRGRTDWLALAIAVVLHGGLLFLAMALVPETARSFALRPVMISATVYVEAPEPVVVPPKIVPEKPRVQKVPAPVLAIPEDVATPEPVEVPVEPQQEDPVPPPEAQALPEPAPEELVATAPPPVLPPRYDADYLDNPAPSYPVVSRRLGEQGTVLLRVYVDAGGAPARVELKQSSGYARLDGVALSTVKRWRFVPARQGTSALGGWVIVPISFNLRS